jgi:hypothetical protein
MDKTTFKMLLEKVRPLIERQDTKLREAISAAERLAVTLLFDETLIVTTVKEIFDKKTLTNFDGIELHPIFLQILMDFDGNQLIRILFWNDEMMFSKQKHMKTRTSSEIILEWTKQHSRCSLRK